MSGSPTIQTRYSLAERSTLRNAFTSAARMSGWAAGAMLVISTYFADWWTARDF